MEELMALTKQEFARLARAGAQARLEELEREREAILRSFPDLGRATPVAPTPSRVRRKRPKMSAAQRKAVGERMKKYWAAKRAKGAAKK
jgi:hypothetical protein